MIPIKEEEKNIYLNIYSKSSRLQAILKPKSGRPNQNMNFYMFFFNVDRFEISAESFIWFKILSFNFIEQTYNFLYGGGGPCFCPVYINCLGQGPIFCLFC